MSPVGTRRESIPGGSNAPSLARTVPTGDIPFPPRGRVPRFGFGSAIPRRRGRGCGTRGPSAPRQPRLRHPRPVRRASGGPWRDRAPQGRGGSRETSGGRFSRRAGSPWMASPGPASGAGLRSAAGGARAYRDVFTACPGRAHPVHGPRIGRVNVRRRRTRQNPGARAYRDVFTACPGRAHPVPAPKRPRERPGPSHAAQARRLNPTSTADRPRLETDPPPPAPST